MKSGWKKLDNGWYELPGVARIFKVPHRHRLWYIVLIGIDGPRIPAPTLARAKQFVADMESKRKEGKP